jgi:hypothetical protein
VSIHSEDRNISKYPNPSCFEIEMPEDVLNVLNLSLVNWSLPTSCNAFSPLQSNVTLAFQLVPSLSGPTSLDAEVFQALTSNVGKDYCFTIETGNYTPMQMAVTLTNKFNEAVTLFVLMYLQNAASLYVDSFTSAGGYQQFQIAFNEVSRKMWFGNKNDAFVLTNEHVVPNQTLCTLKNELPNFSNWGLPGFLGLTKSNTCSVSGLSAPRFYSLPGTESEWLLPNTDVSGGQVYWVEPPFQINLSCPEFVYLELEGQNCIDETSPYNVSTFTAQTNQTNGIVNSSFAKIRLGLCQPFVDKALLPYKEFMPPAEKIRKLKIKLRHHNGQLVDFGNHNYSLLFEFVLVQPTQARTFTQSFSHR